MVRSNCTGYESRSSESVLLYFVITYDITQCHKTECVLLRKMPHSLVFHLLCLLVAEESKGPPTSRPLLSLFALLQKPPEYLRLAFSLVSLSSPRDPCLYFESKLWYYFRATVSPGSETWSWCNSLADRLIVAKCGHCAIRGKWIQLENS